MSGDILDPYEKFMKSKYKTSSERKNLMRIFIKDIGIYNENDEQLIHLDKEIGNLNKIFCDNCVKLKKHLNFNWGQMIDKFNYCCTEECLLNNLDQNNKTVKIFEELKKKRKEKKKEVEKLFIDYRVAISQQQRLTLKSKRDIADLKKEKCILVFKKRNINNKINFIQISIIFVSAFITIFETIKDVVQFSNFFLIFIPILASTYIGLIVAISRFFKLDLNNENLGKVIEKYSFIINRLRHRKRSFENFDFNLKPLSSWYTVLELQDKDSIEDIITKTNEDRDMLITLGEEITYSKKYSNLKINQKLQKKNLEVVINAFDGKKKIRKESFTKLIDINTKTLYQRIIYYLCCCRDDNLNYLDYYDNSDDEYIDEDQNKDINDEIDNNDNNNNNIEKDKNCDDKEYYKKKYKKIKKYIKKKYKNIDLNSDDFDEIIVEEFRDGSKREKKFELNKYKSNEIKKKKFYVNYNNEENNEENNKIVIDDVSNNDLPKHKTSEEKQQNILLLNNGSLDTIYENYSEKLPDRPIGPPPNPPIRGVPRSGSDSDPPPPVYLHMDSQKI